MHLSDLEEFGLGSGEAKLYVALLELGTTTAGKLAEKTKINRRSVYDLLQSLQEKGLSSFVLKDNVKVYSAVDPIKFKQVLQEKLSKFDEILPELNSLKSKSGKSSSVIVLEGKKSIKFVYDSIASEAKIVRILGSSGGFKNIMGELYSEKWNNLVRQKKIKAMLIVSNKSEAKPTILDETKYLPENFVSPSSTLIWNGKVAIIHWLETPKGILIHNEDVAKQFANYHSYLWQIAKS